MRLIAFSIASLRFTAQAKSFETGKETGRSVVQEATLTGGDAAKREGLWRMPASVNPLLRKGGDINATALPGVELSSILRFWPVGAGQVVVHTKVSGMGVTAANDKMLVLLQATNGNLMLMRKGSTQPGSNASVLTTISAVDVNPVSGDYVVVGTLSGPAGNNQGLWTGGTLLGNDIGLQAARLPILRLRKGERYRSDRTPLSIIRSITLKPAVDTTGAGGRGLAQVIGSGGQVAVTLVGDRNIGELVLLP